LFELKNVGKSDYTVKTVSNHLKYLSKYVDLDNPEDVRSSIANKKCSNSYKMRACIFLEQQLYLFSYSRYHLLFLLFSPRIFSSSSSHFKSNKSKSTNQKDKRQKRHFNWDCFMFRLPICLVFREKGDHNA